jgi:hypothetical protein
MAASKTTMDKPTFESFNTSDVNLDGFDFNLEEDNDDLMLADSKTSNVSMDLNFEEMKEELTSSLNDLNFEDALSEVDEPQPMSRPSTDARASRGRRSLLSKSKTFQMKDINFDPPAANNGSSLNDDVSFVTAQTQATNQVSNALPSSASLSSVGQSTVFTLENYNGALEQLAKTMKRTEESRRQVMLQRAMLAQQEEDQRQAEEQALRQAMAYRAASMRNQMNSGFEGMNNGSSSLSGAAGFFTGSSGTLTSGLAQSRRQLQMYMAQMNGQTF